MSALTCKHKGHPENAEWPELDALEHFTDCLTPRERAQYWHWMREQQACARTCFEADHQSLKVQLVAHGNYTQKLVIGIRNLIGNLEQPRGVPPQTVLNTLQALIS